MKTNLLAAVAASDNAQQMSELCEKYGISVDDGFEITFNQACNQIGMGCYDAAIELLEIALRAGTTASLLEKEFFETRNGSRARITAGRGSKFRGGGD